MKNKVLLICGSLLLLLFIVLGTYTWYLFFLRTTGEYSIVTGEGTRSGDIVLIDNGNSIYETDASDVSDEDVNNVLPYKFKIINQGNDLQEYTLYLEDLPVNSINDGCTNQTLLKREQLKYQLIVNSKVIKEDYLSNIKDNIFIKIITPSIGKNIDLIIILQWFTVYLKIFWVLFFLITST